MVRSAALALFCLCATTAQAQEHSGIDVPAHYVFLQTMEGQDVYVDQAILRTTGNFPLVHFLVIDVAESGDGHFTIRQTYEFDCEKQRFRIKQSAVQETGLPEMIIPGEEAWSATIPESFTRRVLEVACAEN